MSDSAYTLAELLICAGSEAWRGDGEVLATGIGLLPRLAASLSMLSSNPDLMMTDSEAYLLSEPNPVGGRGADFRPKYETWMGFSRIFDNVWGGKRHAMVGPTQIDRFGQANISCIGDPAKPKAQISWKFHQPREFLLRALAQHARVQGGRVRHGLLHRLQPGAAAEGLFAGRGRYPFGR